MNLQKKIKATFSATFGDRRRFGSKGLPEFGLIIQDDMKWNEHVSNIGRRMSVQKIQLRCIPRGTT